MKNWLKRMLKNKEDQRSALKTKGQKAETIEEVRSIGNQIEALDAEIADFRNQLNALDEAEGRTAEGDKGKGEGEEPEFRSAKPVNQPTPQQLDPMATYTTRSQEVPEIKDPFGTMEYRRAFMDFVKTGNLGPELRAGVDQFADTTDLGAVIPTTILDEIIKKLKVYGQVFGRVRKLSIKGGVQVPILGIKPTAQWIGEDTPSKRKKVSASSSVTFSYHGLECKIALSLLADTVTLASFENTVVEIIVEAMVKALDEAVFSGTGDGQLLGITKDTRVPAAQVITMSGQDFLRWGQWKKKVFAKMPLAYKAGAAFYMASGTFEGYIDGMTDALGQPIGRVNYGITNGAQERFGGKEVILVEDDIITPYDDAEKDDVVAVYVDLKNYALNSNMQLSMFRYLDHDTNQVVNKAILIADGKLLDPNGVVIVVKGDEKDAEPDVPDASLSELKLGGVSALNEDDTELTYDAATATSTLSIETTSEDAEYDVFLLGEGSINEAGNKITWGTTNDDVTYVIVTVVHGPARKTYTITATRSGV